MSRGEWQEGYDRRVKEARARLDGRELDYMLMTPKEARRHERRLTWEIRREVAGFFMAISFGVLVTAVTLGLGVRLFMWGAGW